MRGWVVEAMGAGAEAITEAAVDWLVVLNSGAVSAEERHGFDAWLAASPEHRAVWQRLTQAIEQTLMPVAAQGDDGVGRNADQGQPRGREMGQVMGQAMGQAVGQAMGQAMALAERRTAGRRRLLRGALAVAGAGSVAALVWAERSMPLGQWAADLRTGTGERQAVTLPEGSGLSLDARSAVDLTFDAGQRVVTLRAGALLADARPAAAGGGSFIVRSAHGELRTPGARFMVRDEGPVSFVGVLEATVRLVTAGGEGRELRAGDAARFGADGIDTTGLPSPLAASAWQHGMLEAHDQPLGDVIDALRAYRRGLIRISDRAAAIRLYGSYALADTDRVLALLAASLPIRVQVYRSGWLVTIDAAA